MCGAVITKMEALCLPSQEITCEIDASYLGLIRENEKHTSLDKKVIHQWLWPCQPSFTFICTFYPWIKMKDKISHDRKKVHPWNF